MRLRVFVVLVFWPIMVFSQAVQIPRASFLLPDDPNFDPEFDWTLNEAYDLFVQTTGGIVTHPGIRLPYFADTGPAAADFNSDLPGVRDILPQDGWVLLFKDFGTPTRGVSFPKIILYNRYRGLLRFFYFNGHFPETFTYGVVSLSTQPASGPIGLFTFTDERKTTLEDFDPDRTEVFIGKLQPLVWNYADFIVAGFDPDVPDDAKMVFQIAGVRSSDVELSGELSLDQILTQANVSTSRSNPLDRILTLGSGIISSYKSAGSLLSSLRGLVDSTKGPFKNAFFARVLRKALQDSFFGSVVPAVAVAASFFKMLLGGSEAAQSHPLKFEGKLSLNGTITMRGDIHSFLLRVPGARHLGNDNLPFYDKPLGVFNLKVRPRIAVRTVMKIQKCRNQEKRERPAPSHDPDLPKGSDIKVQVGPKILELPFPATHEHRLDRLKIVINPDAGITADVQVAFIRPNALPDFYRNENADGFFDISKIPVLKDRLKGPAMCDDPPPKVKKRNLAVKLTIEPDPPVQGFTPITLVKLYPTVYRDGGVQFPQ